jgi:hypothetical protein
MTPVTPNLKRLAFVESAAVTSLTYVADSSAFTKACGQGLTLVHFSSST